MTVQNNLDGKCFLENKNTIRSLQTLRHKVQSVENGMSLTIRNTENITLLPICCVSGSAGQTCCTTGVRNQFSLKAEQNKGFSTVLFPLFFLEVHPVPNTLNLHHFSAGLHVVNVALHITENNRFKQFKSLQLMYSKGWIQWGLRT